MSKVFAGIGARKTPDNVLIQMLSISRKLCTQQDYWCRTGAAIGADQAFALGVPDKTILYLPWSNYEQDFWWDDIESKEKYHIGRTYPSSEAVELASKFHPNWKVCKTDTRRLHGRNAHIILGRDLNSPVEFVVYWAEQDKNGYAQGGTGLGVRLAAGYSIPSYNLNSITEKKLFYDRYM